MEELNQRLEQLRKEDIDFFAKRYTELFGKYFGKTTPEQILEFENQIKSILNKNAPRYVIDDSRLDISHAGGMSLSDKIVLPSYGYEDKDIRIHELVHSFNQIDLRKHGLKDFDSDFVLKHIDEGSTEMIAQLLLGNKELKNTNYSKEVELTNFLTHLVGERIMILATRGNPQLLSQEVDRLLETTDFLRQLEEIEYEHDRLISQSFGEDHFWGTQIPKDIELMSKLKLEIIRDKDAISLLYEAIEKTNNLELLRKFEETDNQYGYNFSMLRWVRQTKANSEQNRTTMAEVQQKMILQELDSMALSITYDPKNVLKKELLKFLYDKIDFQRYFVDKKNYQYGEYQLSPEDIEYCESFKSSFDGSDERLGGRLGLTGVGNKVHELDNVIFSINNNHANKIYIPELEHDELTDKRLEIISEQLLIAQQREILKEWKFYIRNVFLKEEFPDFDDDMLDELISDLDKELELKEQHIIEKYRHPNLNKDEITENDIIESTQQHTQSRIHKPYIRQETIRTVFSSDTIQQEQIPWASQKEEELEGKFKPTEKKLYRPIISEDVKKSAILRDEKQKLHEMKEQLLDYQEQQSMNQETEYEEESHGMSM